ncbi:MAG: extracellular solute-binding protein [Deltaproteobacteria bacterium]|nr:extracellular solute-binding protein [Deltaproteobacteria bacterium]
MLSRAVAIVVALVAVLVSPGAFATPVRLWHAYRGDEARALEELVVGAEVELLAVPSDAYATKLSAAIPHGQGPDLFIDAHERLGDYLRLGLVADLPLEAGVFAPAAEEGVRLGGRAYGIPLSQKCVALFLNESLVGRTPTFFEDLEGTLIRPLAQGQVLLAYENRSAYYHAPILAAFGGRLLASDEGFGFVGAQAERSLSLVRTLQERGAVPSNADGALVTQLFRAGRAAFAVSGPWLAGDLHADGLRYRVVPLPKLRETNEPMRPLLTVEALMASPAGAARPEVLALARRLTSREAAVHRMRVAHVVSARRDVPLPDDPIVRGFAEAALLAQPMPTSPAMRAVWEPAEKAIRKVLSGSVEPHEALDEAKRRFDDVRRPPPAPTSPTPLLLLVSAGLLVGAFALVRRARDEAYRAEVRASLPAYRYVAHAVLALGVLVFAPLLAGAAISLTSGRPGEGSYVGLGNFVAILTARGGPLLATGTFYFVLGVTLAWTLANVTLHLAIGATLGVLLSRPVLRLKAVYRVLLIVPWAVPSYVTALAWKGMFHRQFGAVTALILGARKLGLDLEPVDWFARFATAFAANVATNVWLGFPFMMVVTISAMTSLPSEVLEAAELDGATRWQRFTRVVLPILRPTMMPAVALGSVWTFNMFNVVFLVSGGEPDGQTDILVSEAYRWAFTRQAQYGYAAAYSVLIFALLFGATKLLGRGATTDASAKS